ncbi:MULTISPECIES: hypothetical protein [unclassified Nocardioides]|uniref:hypothetical protein n=1 Tax=unclassified Nocardioides TaxID=2615069 RepID=UPI0007008EA4|nr:MULTISPECIES: hypothetical protein [unclassified Nocardioides]KQY54504.1 hypothetical protein ASD30_17790 [Nocardioides sp. Root140]KQZ66379.1 hypothetical protein ASD66_22870 [Nocardioides sp. Root151]KRF19579.1 hypothetical protein ASH02_23750 [Nocardioides sp. Soil796]
MTTESKRNLTRSGESVLLGAAVGALLLGALASVTGALVADSAAAYGALAGTLIVVLVFAGGSFLVNLVAGISPAASLLIALLTYTLQVVLIGVIFYALADSGLVDDVLDGRWLAGAVIVGTVGWMVSQIVLTTRLRLPAYDLTDAGAR